jgi:chromosome segregation ATPase
MRASERRWALGSATFLLCGLICLSPVGAQQQQQQDGEARARAALRQATAQVRDLQDQNASLLAKQSEAERERMELARRLADSEKDVAELRSQIANGKTALDRNAAQLTMQLQAQQENLEKSEMDYRDNLAKWQAAYMEAADAVQARDAEAKRFEAALVQLRGREQSCEGMNGELYKIANEILTLYEKQDVVSVLRSTEPVTRLKRVQFEELIQRYADQLRANEVSHPVQ